MFSLSCILSLSLPLSLSLALTRSLRKGSTRPWRSLHGKAEDAVDKFSGVLDVAEIMLSGVGMIPGLDTLCGNLNLFDLRMLDYK